MTGIPTQLGPYEVGPKIGGGGMATVYLGRKDDDVVALKVIRDELKESAQYVHMFLDEAKILSRLSHPDIIVTRDSGVAEGARFIAMELLIGRSMMDTFDRVAERGERMPLDLAAFVALHVAGALGYAHALKSETGAPLHVIHRDVNPTNIFLTYDGRVKLIDFGLAKSAGRLAKSGEGVVKGKVPYLSPEQIEEKPFDHRTDIYALGASLWEMTTGRRLFKRQNDVDTIRAIRAHDIPDPSEFVEGIYPDALWKIVKRALERDPADRYESAEAMVRDLEAFLAKHGRKGEMPVVLAAWLEDLFPGERAKQEEWLATVSAVRNPAPKTMAPPAPIAEVTTKSAEAPIAIIAQAREPQIDETIEPVNEPAKTTRHPIAALVALVVTFGVFVALAAAFSRC